MQRTCTQCSVGFDITSEDLAFYEKVSPVFNGKKEAIPPPTLCPECRMQRRIAYRNERSLFHRKCDLTGKQIIAMYPSESPYTVYEKGEWYGGNWDPLSYGRDFDFSRPFFEQFAELKLVVPRMSLVQQKEMVNSEYVNRASYCKNCYLVFSSNYNEDCYFGTNMQNSKNCLDGYNVQRCELCYECVDSYDCYNCAWLEACKNCSDSRFLKNCVGCKNCLFCTNLQQKEYCIFNTQYTKAEYEKQLRETFFSRTSVIETLKEKFRELKKTMIVKDIVGTSNERVSGNCLDHCKNTLISFDCREVEDGKYLQSVTGARDCMDFSFWGRDSELVYEVHGTGYMCREILFSNECWENVQDLILCDSCMNSSHLFGCIGLRGKQYCVFNKQYSKEEYETLVPKIIEHMRTTREWGEYFPMTLCHFGYNETVVQDYFPRTKEDVLAHGWKWQEEQSSDNYMGPKIEIPDDVADAADDITTHILRCEITGKPYKITAQELAFYRERRIPVPRKSPDRRHHERLALRTPRRLWKRHCAKCSKDIETSYAPDRPEIVYCESCYLQTVY